MHQPRKRFGQNFLTDDNYIRKIVDSIAAKPSDHLVEIGPGKGALTTEILGQIDTLDLIEMDRDLIELLTTKFADKDITIHNADALKFDYQQLIRDTKANSQQLRIFGNLPYNISTPLIFHLLKYCNIIQDMVFMLQHEVVQRLCAKPNNKTYGRLSVMVQYFAFVEPLFTVPASAFYPQPKVTSQIVRLIPYKKSPFPALNDISCFTNTVRSAFNQRRKTLKNSLSNNISAEQLQSINIEPQARAEQLSIEQFIQISNLISATM